MITFQQYLTEKSASVDLSIFRPHLSVERMASLEKRVGELLAAEEAGQIYNARYKEMKDVIMSHLSGAINQQFYQTPDGALQSIRAMEARTGIKYTVFDLPSSISSTVSIKKELRDTEAYALKFKPSLPALDRRVKMYKIAAGIVEKIQALKSKVIAGREKIIDPNVPQKFHAQYSPDAGKKMHAFFTKLVAPQREEFIDNLTKLMVFEVQEHVIKPKNQGGVMTQWKLLQKSLRFYQVNKVHLLFSSERHSEAKVKRDWKDIVRAQAVKESDAQFEKFIYKNASKLAAIFEKKGDPKKTTVERIDVNGLTLTSMVHFELASGANFRVSNSMVYGYRSGRLYVQFPTRFHDVIKADGKKMASPSEEKMNTEF